MRDPRLHMLTVAVRAGLAEAASSGGFRTLIDIEAEDEAARREVARLLQLPSAAITCTAEEEGHRTVAFVQAVSELMDERSDALPADVAVALTTVAALAAEHLPAAFATVACIAWKEQANALRSAGDIPGAKRAVARAFEWAARTALPEYHAAIVRCCGAVVSWEALRYEDALSDLQAARIVYEAMGETDRLREVQQWEAGLAFDMGRPDLALPIYQTEMAAAMLANDRRRLSGACTNLALTHSKLGELDCAKMYLARASAAARNDSKESSVVAITLREIGRFAIIQHGERGLSVMDEAFRMYASLGLSSEVLCTRLVAVDALLQHAPMADVEDYCRETFDVASRIGADIDSLRALMHLCGNSKIERADVATVQTLIARSTIPKTMGVQHLN